jgi:hypothetical protein
VPSPLHGHAQQVTLPRRAVAIPPSPPRATSTIRLTTTNTSTTASVPRDITDSRHQIIRQLQSPAIYAPLASIKNSTVRRGQRAWGARLGAFLGLGPLRAPLVSQASTSMAAAGNAQLANMSLMAVRRAAFHVASGNMQAPQDQLLAPRVLLGLSQRMKAGRIVPS